MFIEPVAPRKLVELQQQVATAITKPLREKSSGSFELYHQQYWWRLFGILQEQYPAVVRLFGYSDFNTFLAEPYFTQCPPNTWFIPYLGRKFPQWVAEFYNEEDKDIVHAVALVDNVHEQLFYGTDTTTLELEADFFRFREQLLQHPVEYWQTAEFPALDWFPVKRLVTVCRTEDGIIGFNPG